MIGCNLAHCAAFSLINDLSCHAWLEHDVARSSLTIYCFPISVFSHSAFHLSLKILGMIIYLLWKKETFRQHITKSSASHELSLHLVIYSNESRLKELSSLCVSASPTALFEILKGCFSRVIGKGSFFCVSQFSLALCTAMHHLGLLLC